MRHRFRMAVFLLSCAAFAVLYVAGLLCVHPFGRAGGFTDAYAQAIDRLTVSERRITDAVTAVNFDFRGFDTLGEEYIMFASVLGVAMLLRQHRNPAGPRPQDRAPGREVSPASDAVRLLAIALVGPTVVFGIYIVVHGQVTPGGGFQGGVVLASAPLLIYLAGEFQSLRRLAPRWLVEASEAIGAGGYVVIGAAAMFFHLAFLTNFLPLGKPGDIFSGGTVAFIDLTVGLEVSGGLILLLLVFLEEVLVRREPV